MMDSQADQQRQTPEKTGSSRAYGLRRCNIDVNNGRVAQGVPGTVQEVQAARWSTVQVPARAHANSRRLSTLLRTQYHDQR